MKTYLGQFLRRKWISAIDSQCIPLTFGDLKAGDKFITMPVPGTNRGHGTLVEGHYLFIKVAVDNSLVSGTNNAVDLTDGIPVNFDKDEIIVKVI